MATIFKRKLIQKTSFQRLPNGAVYYSSTGTSGPFVKMRNGYRLATNNDPQNNPTGLAVTPGTSVIRVDQAFLHSRGGLV